MAVIAAIMLERLNLATRLAANSQAMTQARFYALSAESIATARIKALVATSPDRTADPRGLLGRDFNMPLSAGMVVALVGANYQ